MIKLLKKILLRLLGLPRDLLHLLYENFPLILGHEIQNNLIQFYRHDSLFQTAISFNHFIEFFSQIENVKMSVEVLAHDRYGNSLGIKYFSIEKKGATQILLSELFHNLDDFGLFSISLKLAPRYTGKIAYLGKISPQFMTMFIPQSDLGCPQMIHSHKLKQGRLFLSGKFIRPSSHIEEMDRVSHFDLFVLNSSKSKLKFKVQVFDESSVAPPVEKTVSLSGFETACIGFDKMEFAPDFKNLSFKYFYSRPVNHKKPIIFRRFENNSWSCNHT